MPITKSLGKMISCCKIHVFFLFLFLCYAEGQEAARELALEKIVVVTTSQNPGILGPCQGDCDNDKHCQSGYYCFQRDPYQKVPGCLGGESDPSKTDYCVRKESNNPQPTAPPVPLPTMHPIQPSVSPIVTPTTLPVVAILPPPTDEPLKRGILVSYGGSPPVSKFPLQLCEGDCDNNSHCAGNMICFQRNSNDPVPGCDGSDPSKTDYCIDPRFIAVADDPSDQPSIAPFTPPTGKPVQPTVTPVPSPTKQPIQPTSTPISSPTAQPIQPTGTPVPSPTAQPIQPSVPSVASPQAQPVLSNIPPPTNEPLKRGKLVSYGGTPPSTRFPLQLCEGDCDNNSHCAGSMICYQRNSNDAVPGCDGSDPSKTDYCIDPRFIGVSDQPTYAPFTSPTQKPVEPNLSPTEQPVLPTVPPEPSPSVQPVQTPVPQPTNEPLKQGKLVSYGGSPPSSKYPLQLCEGDCDNDSQCLGNLICFQRDSNDPVPGCEGSDPSKTDYCIDPRSIGREVDSTEYAPGVLTVYKVGLLLSQGLDARQVAVSGSPVNYVDGRSSDISFHFKPDAGATFPDYRPGNEGGWVYVSNSELNYGAGGVGAITFDSSGNVLEYKMVLEGTTMNCGGGRTPWNTWVSCEEARDRMGHAYQVDPFGERSPEKMSLGAQGGKWESFAFDVRDKSKPRFFMTEDHQRGALIRFTPLYPDWNNTWSLLHTEGTTEFLKLTYNHSSGGSFEWTTDRNDAMNNAMSNYPDTEGIDVRGSELLFVSKTLREIFSLNLDTGLWYTSSTVHGLFDGEPDQLQRILHNPKDLLYFTEEGGVDAGIHARDEQARYYTIMESPTYPGETTGLALSPDGKFMYLAYQEVGRLFCLWRLDGKSFAAEHLDVKYHQSNSR